MADPLEDEAFDDASEPQARGFVTELLRKIAVAGLGAYFLTEEGLRALASQLKLPKELLGVILAQAERTKSEIGRIVSEEVRSFLQSDRVRDELIKLLSQMTVEVKAEVRLRPADPSASTLVVKNITAHRAGARRGRKD